MSALHSVQARRTGAGRPHLRLLATLVGLALAQWAATPALADSGTGVDTSLGNAMNPAGMSTGRPRDPDGLGEALHSRTPTGFMTVEPWLIRDPSKSESSWVYSGLAEIGGMYVGGDRDAAKFLEYKDLDRSLYLNNFWLQAEKPADAYFVESTAGALGRDDQYFGLTTGRYNSWKIKAFYNETNHVFTTTYRNLWNGTGSNLLTLRNLPAGPLAPATAATNDIAIGNAALATPYSSLSVIRQKGGVRYDVNLGARWKAFASYTNEKRKGSRPFGLVGGGGGGTGGVEIPESVDYDTHDFLAGVQWNSGLTSANLQASASLFRNNTGTLTVENPLFLPAANGIANFPRAVFDLYPDNDFYNIKAEFAHAIPEVHRTRFTGVVSASSSRQNDNLIPMTPYSGAVVGGVAGGAWDTVASLSKSSADARIDSRLIDLGLSMTPATGFDVKGKLRQYETKNDSEYWACNPLTGQWGRLINDGSGAAMPNAAVTAANPPGTLATAYNAAMCNKDAVRALGLVPSAGNNNIGAAPYEYKQFNASLGFDYRFARNQSFNAQYERENFDREHRERSETWEDKVKLGYVNRVLPGGTLRASLEYGQRRGSTYNPDPYEEFYSASLGPYPAAVGVNVTSWIHINDLHRKFDLADRDQTVLNVRWNHAVSDDVDLAISAQAKDLKFPAAYGRNGHQRLNSINVDMNWQPSPEMNVYGFASFQNGRMKQTGIQQNACIIGTTYYFYSDGSMNTTGLLTPAQIAAGITVIGNSGPVTGDNFLALCGSASPTSPLYPTSRAFSVTQDDTTTALGLGLRRAFPRVLVDFNYTHTRGRTTTSYTYNPAALGLATSGAPTAAELTTLALIGNGLPALLYQQDLIDLGLVIPIQKTTTVRLMLRHEIGKIRDWHYDGVAANPTPAVNQQTYLDSGPKDYQTTTIGAFLQFAW